MILEDEAKFGRNALLEEPPKLPETGQGTANKHDAPRIEGTYGS